MEATKESNMAKNYGISFCKQVLSNLEKKEDELFEKHGYGFDKWGEDYKSELEHKRLLKKFEQEKNLGAKPSYDPIMHGSLTC
jgi:hypothetical protein